MAANRAKIEISAHDRTAAAFSKVTRRLKGLKRSVFSLKGAMGALGAGLVFRKIIQATIEQEAAFRQVEAAIISTKGAAGLSAKEIGKMAAELQKVTTFGDEAILRVQSKILTFTGITKGTFAGTTEAVLDLATRMQGDLTGAVVMLGKVLNAPVANMGALSRAGIQFTDGQKSMIKSLVESGDLLGAQKIILGELSTQFGGSARAARDTFGGAISGLGNAFGDLLEGKTGLNEAKIRIEEVTSLLQDPKTLEQADKLVTALINGFTKIVGALPEITAFLNDIFDVKTYSPEQLRREIDLTTEALERQRAALQKIKDDGLVKDQPKSFALERSIDSLTEKMAGLMKQQRLLDAVKARAAQQQKMLTTVINTGTKATVKNAEAAATAVVANKKAEAIMKGLTTAEEKHIAALQQIEDLGPEAFGGMAEYEEAISRTEAAYDKLNKKTKDADKFANDLGLTFSSAFEDAVVGGGRLSDVLKGLAQDIVRIFARKAITEPLAAGIGSIFSGMNFGSIFGFADGGRPPVGKVSVVGERGPELFIPDSAGTVIPNGQAFGGGGGMKIYQTINVNGNGDAALARAVAEGARQGAEGGYARVSDDFNRRGPLAQLAGI